MKNKESQDRNAEKLSTIKHSSIMHVGDSIRLNIVKLDTSLPAERSKIIYNRKPYSFLVIKNYKKPVIR